VYVIAELSANHNQSFSTLPLFRQLSKRAPMRIRCRACADVDVGGIELPAARFRIAGEHFTTTYQEAAMPWEWQPKLKQVADDAGLHAVNALMKRLLIF